jgi:hypothetical protein
VNFITPFDKMELKSGDIVISRDFYNDEISLVFVLEFVERNAYSVANVFKGVTEQGFCKIVYKKYDDFRKDEFVHWYLLRNHY